MNSPPRPGVARRINACSVTRCTRTYRHTVGHYLRKGYTTVLHTYVVGLTQEYWIVALISHRVTRSMSDFGFIIIDGSQFRTITIKPKRCPRTVINIIIIFGFELVTDLFGTPPTPTPLCQEGISAYNGQEIQKISTSSLGVNAPQKFSRGLTV